MCTFTTTPARGARSWFSISSPPPPELGAGGDVLALRDRNPDNKAGHRRLHDPRYRAHREPPGQLLDCGASRSSTARRPMRSPTTPSVQRPSHRRAGPRPSTLPRHEQVIQRRPRHGARCTSSPPPQRGPASASTSTSTDWVPNGHEDTSRRHPCECGMGNAECGIAREGRRPRRTFALTFPFHIPHFAFGHAASSTATVSTWAVCGNRSNARIAAMR